MRLAPLLILVFLAGVASTGGCDENGNPKGNVVIFNMRKRPRRHVQGAKITGYRFELAISNDFTFADRPGTMGAGMALMLDAILAQDYTVMASSSVTAAARIATSR